MNGWLVSALVLLRISAVASAREATADVVVYGGTSGGVVAAVQAARMHKSVLLIEPSRHLGGLTAGGLGATDIGNKQAIGGLAREFYRRVHQHYARPDAWVFERREDYHSSRQQPGEETQWTFEPHVAEAIFDAWVREAKVELWRNERLDLAHGVEKRGMRITAIRLESGSIAQGRMFIDATYEGDLMAKAGVSFHVGREGNATYGETLNGVQLKSRHHQFHVLVDPYRTPDDPASGLLPGIHAGPPGEHGSGDERVQAYCYRMCLTDVPKNRLPFPKPASYDPLRYELAIRTILAGQWDGLGSPHMMPNRKTDTNNNGAFSTDNIGMNYDYPNGDHATRRRIEQEHVDYQQGWLWFLSNDPRVPARIRDEVSRWGLAKDEFVDNGNWPHQLYVREARRMVSDLVMTEHHCQGDQIVADGVGLAAYGMDSHNVQRYVLDGHASNEGDVQVHGFVPYPISYRAIIPRATECENLLVPVCVSASHIAYGSIRMEPVFMVLGQSAATAAALALEAGTAVQQVDIARLQERLRADGQVLAWSGKRPYRGKDPKQLAGIVVDDADATLVGRWTPSRANEGYVGLSYLHDDNADQGNKEVRFEIPVPKAGRYDARLAYTVHTNRATAVEVVVRAADGEHRLTVNQRKRPAIDGTFASLGTYQFHPEEPAEIIVRNRGADGYVVADAVQLVPVKE